MKIDLLAGGDLATLELCPLRVGRAEVLVEKFDENTGGAPVGRGIMEAPQLLQLAAEALRLAGYRELAARIPRFSPWWRN